MLDNLGNSIDNAATNLTDPLTKEVGRTLANLWELAFGGFNEYVTQKRILSYSNIEECRKSIDDRVSTIPKENLQEPQLSVIGPALEATKYYIEEDELRSMFIKLISKSFDSRYNDRIHPSFTEIIKQLSPRDAYNLYHVFEDNVIYDFKVSFCEGTISAFINDVYIGNRLNYSLFEQTLSTSTLKRLGLFCAAPLKGGKFVVSIFHDGTYDISRLIYGKPLQDKTPLSSKLLNNISFIVDDYIKKEIRPGVSRFIFKEKHIAPTSLGQAFLEVCLAEN